jgi:serine/threonine protein kinase
MGDPLLPIQHVPADLMRVFSGPGITEYGFNSYSRDLGQAIIREILEKGNKDDIADYLGSGAISSTFKYEHKGIPYILRITPLSYGGNNEYTLREIDAYTQLNKTAGPYISKLLYAITAKNMRQPLKGAVFIFPYLEGQTFDAYLKTTESISLAKAMKLLTYFLEACAFMDKRGIVHRDIKPENIYLPTKQEPYLFDLDVACDVRDAGCSTLMFEGTRRYALPKAKSRLPQGVLGFDASKRYRYSVWSDKYSVIVMFVRDVFPLIESNTDKAILLDACIDEVKQIFKKNNDINKPTPEEEAASVAMLEKLILKRKLLTPALKRLASRSKSHSKSRSKSYSVKSGSKTRKSRTHSGHPL